MDDWFSSTPEYQVSHLICDVHEHPFFLSTSVQFLGKLDDLRKGSHYEMLVILPRKVPCGVLTGGDPELRQFYRAFQELRDWLARLAIRLPCYCILPLIQCDVAIALAM